MKKYIVLLLVVLLSNGSAFAAQCNLNGSYDDDGKLTSIWNNQSLNPVVNTIINANGLSYTNPPNSTTVTIIAGWDPDFSMILNASGINSNVQYNCTNTVPSVNCEL